MILAALSERALAESRKCCAMRTDHERKDRHLHDSISYRVQGRFRRWQQLHNTGFLTFPFARPLSHGLGRGVSRI